MVSCVVCPPHFGDVAGSLAGPCGRLLASGASHLSTFAFLTFISFVATLSLEAGVDSISWSIDGDKPEHSGDENLLVAPLSRSTWNVPKKTKKKQKMFMYIGRGSFSDDQQCSREGTIKVPRVGSQP